MSIALFLVAPFLAAAQATADRPPAKVADLAAAAASCRKAVSATGVDEASLTADGWRPATVQSKGKPADTPLRFYGRAAGNVILTTMAEPGSAACVALARVEPGVRAPLETALTAAIGAAPVLTTATETIWIDRGVVTQFAATGSKDKPGVRIATAYGASKRP